MTTDKCTECKGRGVVDLHMLTTHGSTKPCLKCKGTGKIEVVDE